MNGYPTRPRFFSHRFCRLLARTAAANEIGPEAFTLLVNVAMLEDSKRYSSPVTFYNEQLMPICGFGGRSRLSRARQAAIDAGWLHYEPGTKSTAGKYWVTIPGRLQDIPDGVSNFDTWVAENGEMPSQNGTANQNAVPKRDDKRSGTGTASEHLTNPNPLPNSLSKKLRSSDGDLRLAKFMLTKIRQAAPKTKTPDLDKWADTIRLMRERDGLTPQEIKTVFEWANRDDFWRTTILSPTKLRKQFAALDAKANSNGQGEPQTIRFDPRDAI